MQEQGRAIQGGGYPAYPYPNQAFYPQQAYPYAPPYQAYPLPGYPSPYQAYPYQAYPYQNFGQKQPSVLDGRFQAGNVKGRSKSAFSKGYRNVIVKNVEISCACALV